jgi:hypothetical protein
LKLHDVRCVICTTYQIAAMIQSPGINQGDFVMRKLMLITALVLASASAHAQPIDVGAILSANGISLGKQQPAATAPQAGAATPAPQQAAANGGQSGAAQTSAAGQGGPGAQADAAGQGQAQAQPQGQQAQAQPQQSQPQQQQAQRAKQGRSEGSQEARARKIAAKYGISW